MGLGRERRLNCRLYVDRQSDAKVVEKLDRLLVEKHFLFLCRQKGVYLLL